MKDLIVLPGGQCLPSICKSRWKQMPIKGRFSCSFAHVFCLWQLTQASRKVTGCGKKLFVCVANLTVPTPERYGRFTNNTVRSSHCLPSFFQIVFL
jgi:hypothetical protein